MKTTHLVLAVAGVVVLMLGGREAATALDRYKFGVNETTSLPNWAFIVDRQNHKPKRDELIAFIAPDNPYYPKGARFVKHVWGLPGDRVERRGREYFVNGRDVGYCKEHSLTGRVTNPGPTGVIPPGHYYVGTPSKDSFDSRYAEIGWIDASRIVGTAEPVL